MTPETALTIVIAAFGLILVVQWWTCKKLRRLLFEHGARMAYLAIEHGECSYKTIVAQTYRRVAVGRGISVDNDASLDDLRAKISM